MKITPYVSSYLCPLSEGAKCAALTGGRPVSLCCGRRRHRERAVLQQIGKLKREQRGERWACHGEVACKPPACTCRRRVKSFKSITR